MLHPSPQLFLNGSSFKHWEGVSITRSLNALSSIDLTLANPIGRYTNIVVEDMSIKFNLGWDTDSPPVLFDGYHDDPTWGVSKKSSNISLSGRDFGRTLFDELTVDDDFNSYGRLTNIDYIIGHMGFLIDNLKKSLAATKNFSRNLSVDNEKVFSYEYGYEKVMDAFTTLAQYGGYEWFMGFDTVGNRQIVVRPPKDLIATNVAHSFIVGDRDLYADIPNGTRIKQIESISVKKQYGYKKNYIKVVGKEASVSARYPNTPPATPKHLYLEDDGITDVTTARGVAQQFWRSKSAPKILVEFSGIGVENLQVGDIVYVNDYRYGASELPTHLFRLIEITDSVSRSSGWKASFRVADFVPTVFGFFQGNDGL